MDKIYKFRLSFFLFIFVPICLLLLSCKSSTKPPNLITVRGTVYLENTSDHSGVKVSLYKPVDLDTALVRLNQDYPDIGVQISQHTEFDHRYLNSSYSSTSKPDGTWKIENVNPGIFNIVAEKDSFGWKYCHEISVTEASISLDTLLRAIYLSGMINNDQIISNRFIIIDNATIERLIIKDCPHLLVHPNSIIYINGQLQCEGNEAELMKITSDVDDNWNGFFVRNNAKLDLTYCIIKDSDSPVYNNQSLSNKYEFNIFLSNGEAIVNSASLDTLLINSNIFKNNTLALSNQTVDYCIIQNNIFIKNEKGIEIRSSEYSHIENNIFYEQDIALDINPRQGVGYSFAGGVINSNNFQKNYLAIFMGDYVHFNGIYNNFILTNDYFIQAVAGDIPVDTLNFQSNYWDIFREDLIKERIYDVDDSETNSGKYVDVRNFSIEPFNL